MHISRLIFSAALAAIVAGTVSLTAPASAAEVYSLPTGTLPDQSWSGSLGLDFTVNSNIVVYALGAFYDGGAPITVALYQTNQTNSSGTLLLETTISTGSPVYTFNAVDPITLTPGYYQITAWGYGSGTGNYNTGTCDGGPCPPLGFNTLGGELSFGLPWYNNPTITGFADNNLDTGNQPPGPQGPYHYYGAGNLEAFATPLPATWTMLIAGFIGLGFFAYRGSKRGAAAIAAA